MSIVGIREYIFFSFRGFGWLIRAVSFSEGGKLNGNADWRESICCSNTDWKEIVCVFPAVLPKYRSKVEYDSTPLLHSGDYYQKFHFGLSGVVIWRECFLFVFRIRCGPRAECLSIREHPSLGGDDFRHPFFLQKEPSLAINFHENYESIMRTFPIAPQTTNSLSSRSSGFCFLIKLIKRSKASRYQSVCWIAECGRKKYNKLFLYTLMFLFQRHAFILDCWRKCCMLC